MSLSDQFTPKREPLLDLRAVDIPSTRYPGSPQIQSVHWQLHPREFWVIGGLLSSGKTNFLTTAAGALAPLRGEIRLFGRVLHQNQVETDLPDRLRIGLVHDGGLLLRHLNVADNISLPLRYHHNATDQDVAKRLSAWLKAMELNDWATEFSGNISRNWAQRAGLARACILEPEILLLDSPLSGLDPQHARWWLQTVAELAEGHPLISYRPMTTVVTCDDFRPWIAPGRNYAVLREGQLEILDPGLPADQIINTLATPSSPQADPR
ncbi:MAG: ATP-binding cassette domain-containing protein [Verrucomicrobiales bacterium]|nr:ATP-binding cassette domain-containing protein [Verrucomicrobiales bacterium]